MDLSCHRFEKFSAMIFDMFSKFYVFNIKFSLLLWLYLTDLFFLYCATDLIFCSYFINLSVIAWMFWLIYLVFKPWFSVLPLVYSVKGFTLSTSFFSFSVFVDFLLLFPALYWISLSYFVLTLFHSAVSVLLKFSLLLSFLISFNILTIILLNSSSRILSVFDGASSGGY